MVRAQTMRTSTLKSQIALPTPRLRCSSNFTNPTAGAQSFIPIKTKPDLKLGSRLHCVCASPSQARSRLISVDGDTSSGPQALEIPATTGSNRSPVLGNGKSRHLVVGGICVGLVLLSVGLDEHKALAFGPEGPLVEEFWENVRRYGLYALTVSTGALYTILLPIFELLKNPISAILLLIILGGSFFIISQVLSAMVGVTNFTYEYGY